MPGAAVPGAAAGAQVLVQGIADLVLVFDGSAEILDYKTDRSRDPAYYRQAYAAQLQLYRRAFALRLGVPVTKLDHLQLHAGAGDRQSRWNNAAAAAKTAR